MKSMAKLKIIMRLSLNYVFYYALDYRQRSENETFQ